MKRFLKIAAVLVFAAAFFVSPAQAGYDQYTINVYKDTGYRSGSFGHPAITSGVQYMVLTAGANTAATIYTDAGLTSINNPVHAVTFDNVGKIKFYLDDSATSCDIIIVDNDGGYTLFLDGVTPSVHSAIINEQPGIMHNGMIWYQLSDDLANWYSISTAAVQDTAIDFHVHQIIHDIQVFPVVGCDFADGNLDIGLGGVSQAFADDVVVGTADVYVELIFSDACTMGNLLYQELSTTGGGGEGYNLEPYAVMTASSLNYTIESNDDGVNYGWGFIHYWTSHAMRQ